MRILQTSLLTQKVKALFIEANVDIGPALVDRLRSAMETEASPIGKNVLAKIIANDEYAKREKIAICQDTGVSVVFIDIGQDVHFEGGDFNEAIHEGVRQAYKEGYLRKSVVSDPLFDRKNTQDNTPAIIHVRIIPGAEVSIKVMPKGFGSENMSALKLFAPSVGIEGVKRFIIETIEKAGPNACPPMIVGVGIGGTFEQAALIAKRAVLRGPVHPNLDTRYFELEKELLNQANRLGIGPAGMGGSTTVLAINIEQHPTHIASIPVAINISCHASRHAEGVL